MKKTHAWAALAALCLASPAMASPAADVAQIKALEARFAAAVDARNLEGIMRTYAPNVFVFDIVPPRQYVGAAAYRKDWQGFLAGFKGPISLKISDLAVAGGGAIAWAHSIQTIEGKGPDGRQMNLTVRVTDVYGKVGGAWKVVHEHVSAPVNLDTGKADLTSAP